MCELTETDVKRIAGEVFNDSILIHLRLCPFGNLEIEKRVRGVENKITALVFFMLGSGMLGGVSGAALVKFFGT